MMVVEDYTEYDFLNILYQHPELVEVVQEIWAFDNVFQNEPLNWVWACMKDLYLRTGTITRIKLQRLFKQLYPKADVSIITAVANRGCFPEQLQGLLTEVRSRMIIRKLKSFSVTVANIDFTSDGMEVLEMASKEVRAIEQGLTFESDIELPEATLRVRDKAERVMVLKNHDDFIPTGFRGIDKRITGVQLGKLTVIGARPSVGKTAIALSFLGNFESIGVQCAFFSAEMDVESLVNRRIQQISKVSLREIADHGMATDKRTQLLHKFQAACDNYKLMSSTVFRCLSNDRRLSNLKLQMRKAKNANPNLKIMFIDYLQKIKPDKKGHDKASEIGEISGDIYDLGKELNVHIFLLAQLNRGADSNERPRMGLLKGSGDIEQDADNILLIHRERLDSKHHDNEEVQDALLIVSKARDAETGSDAIKFHKKTTHFYDRVDDHYTEEPMI